MNAVPQNLDTGEHRLKPPELPALVITREHGPPVHVVTWCPWCEGIHYHGAAGGGGNRAPHCAEDRESPLGRTGYNLDILGEAASEKAILPAGLMVGQRRLHRIMDQASGALRAVLLRFLLEMKAIRGPVIQKRMPQGGVWIFGSENWLIEPRGRKAIEGLGFLRLASALYGVPPGIAAVRFLEAVSCDLLDAEAAFAVQHAIDAWVARGAPSRPSR